MNNNDRNNNRDRARPQRAQLPPMNETIRFPSFVVIDENSNNLGELVRAEALRLGEQKGLDVVIISPNANPPIAKLMDYGRFLYEQKRKKRESKKKQTVIRVKEINVKPTIGAHDLKWRADNAKRWLDEGFHVKFTVKAFNRMITRDDIINKLYESFIEMIGEHGEVEKGFTRSASNMYEANIIPNKNHKPKPATKPISDINSSQGGTEHA
ncbi:translation initiation factor IF-3 [[Mycoplasma] testudinis]|uniref:translation initiation factor IF-3 n=1 Tax=[Mycoplasma] testudinis TaxID=33924 RepID=UPI000A06D5FA|nr:translation initiation factor IF-3 [[Mycoplasma] testudinis]